MTRSIDPGASSNVTPLEGAKSPALPALDIETLLPLDKEIVISRSDLVALKIKDNGFSDRPDLSGQVFVVTPRDGQEYLVSRFHWELPAVGVSEYWPTRKAMSLQIERDGTSQQPGCQGACFTSRSTRDGFEITRHQFDFDFPSLPFNTLVRIPTEVMPKLEILPDGTSRHPELGDSRFKFRDLSSSEGVFTVIRMAL